MNAEKIPQSLAPQPMNRLNYAAFAEVYNSMELGEVRRFDRVSNITQFKQALSRRLLEENTDYKAYQKGRHLYVKRQTPKTILG